jgi:hypothetical protein
MIPDFLDISSEGGLRFQASSHEMQTRVAELLSGKFRKYDTPFDGISFGGKR